MDISIILGLALVGLYFISKRSHFALHMLQLEEYNTDNYKKWVFENKERAYDLKKDDKPVKKALVFTNRAKRLYNTNLIINGLILLVPLLILFVTGNPWISYIIALIIGFVIYKFQTLIMILSNTIMLPIEKNINLGFYRRAQEKIKSMEDLTVVGITGSYGKTSTKFIMETILKEKYNVLNTPDSYNTPMGLSKVINNELNDKHEIFIAELGARIPGEIKEVAELVQPDIGVITAIGPVHMETFKSIDIIMKTKYELIEELPTEGIAIFNNDNTYVKKLADKTFKEKFMYGFDHNEEVDIYAEEIEVSELGSSFTLKNKDGESIRCKTKLLGKHNIYNILAGVSVAIKLGLTFEEIARGIEKIQPIPHRLNIINPGTGIIIIDDAFNSNPIGTKAALDVLSEFKEGRKIIVTPGMVELGDMEEEANREFGKNIGKTCDFAILVGKNRSKPIYEGLMETNFNPSNIFIVNTLDEASQRLGKITRPKDVVLFENDLPDNYSE